MNVSTCSSISKTNPNIMEYLAQKLESKAKTIINSKQYLNNIFDIQTLQSNKKNLLSILSDLEDDVKQASYAIKGLLTENKALTLELDQLKEKHFSLEENNTNFINELTQNNNYLLNENSELREQLNMVYQNNQLIEGNDYTKHLSHITEENELEIPLKKIATQDTESSSNSPLKNVKTIISDMKNNKKKLKDVIKKHFNGQGQPQSEVQYSNNPPRTKNSSDILMRVMNSQANINTLNERLGNDFMQKMLSTDCSDEYLTQIENILNETEEPTREKLPMRIRNCKSKSKSKSKPKDKHISKQENNRSFSNSYIKSSTPLNQSTTLKGNSSFETSLRDYPSRPKQSKGSKPKFNPYVNPYGKYFTNPNDQMTNIKSVSN